MLYKFLGLLLLVQLPLQSQYHDQTPYRRRLTYEERTGYPFSNPTMSDVHTTSGGNQLQYGLGAEHKIPTAERAAAPCQECCCFLVTIVRIMRLEFDKE